MSHVYTVDLNEFVNTTAVYASVVEQNIVQNKNNNYCIKCACAFLHIKVDVHKIFVSYNNIMMT